MLKNPPSSSEGVAVESALSAHWAKYTCVLISGYIEQSVKEILLEHVSKNSGTRINRYVERTWPSSRNMRYRALFNVLEDFEPGWAEKFESWVDKDERKKEINEIVSWRNSIAHGKESNTNNVTLSSVKEKFRIACQLVDYIEGLPRSSGG